MRSDEQIAVARQDRRSSALSSLIGPVAWLGFGVWGLTLWVLSSLSPTNVPDSGLPHFDKLLHFGYFLGGGVLLTVAVKASFRLPTIGVVLLAGSVLTGVGVLDEWHQLHTPGRQGGDGLDLLADCLGAVVGISLGLVGYGFAKRLLS